MSSSTPIIRLGFGFEMCVRKDNKRSRADEEDGGRQEWDVSCLLVEDGMQNGRRYSLPSGYAFTKLRTKPLSIEAFGKSEKLLLRSWA